MTQPLTLGAFLAACREASGKTQAQVAAACAITPGSDLSNRTGAPQARFRSRPRLGRCPTD